jgi:glutaredoxin
MVGSTFNVVLESWAPRQAGTTIVVFHRERCPHCLRALDVLDRVCKADPGTRLVKVDVETDPLYARYARSMKARLSHDTVPKVFVDGRFVGGATETVAKYPL